MRTLWINMAWKNRNSSKVIVGSILGSIQFIVIVTRYCYGIANVKTGKDRDIVVK